MWAYLGILLLSLLDGFFPVVPSESSVITAGVFAANGSLSLPLVILVAAVGAFAGDHISYFIGRGFGGRLLSRMKPGTRRHIALLWARKAITERGGLILVVARYIPGGRTAITLTMGSMAYPLRRFSFFAAIAATSWAIYSALIGYLGGVAFEKEPLKGLLFGLGLALAVTAIVEALRYFRSRRIRTSGTGAPPAVSTTSSMATNPADA